MSWAKTCTLETADDWEDYSGRIESAVSAMELEIAFTVLVGPIEDGDDEKEVEVKSVLDANDEDSANPKDVVELKDDVWKAFIAKQSTPNKKKFKQAQSLLVLTVGKAYSHLTRIKKVCGYTWARLRLEFEGTRPLRLLSLYRQLFTKSLGDFQDNFSAWSAFIEQTVKILRRCCEDTSKAHDR